MMVVCHGKPLPARYSLLSFALLIAAVCGCVPASSQPAIAVPPDTPSGSAKVDDRMSFAATDWPWWRGPNRDGIARADQHLPTTWGETENVLWKSEVPGRGHGSPTVVGNCVYLPTADEQSGSQSVLCFDRATGKQLWQTEVHPSGGMRKNAKSSAASSSVACDNERLFICFANSGAVFATALDRDGHKLWQTRFSDYLIHQGYASSPAVYQSVVLVSADHKGGGAMAALDRTSGKIVWKQARPPAPNYTSPIILRLAGRDQVLLTGCDQVVSYHPLSGKILWEAAGATTECVTSTVTDGKRVFTSGGYPRNHTAAMLADGSGKIAWESKNRVYVPSLLVRDGYLFGVLDAGIASCWKSDTGEEMWKARLGGNFSASPVLAGDRIYVTNEIGETYVYHANTEKFEQLAVNRLGDEAFATPTICGGNIYLRVAHQAGGRRQEMLYCVGKPN